MTISYLLAPIPKWIIIGKNGLTAGGAKLYTKRTLNKVQNKTVYQDPAGTIPWENPILFDADGTKGPFYWSVDTANLNDTYYLEAYDSDNNLLWTQDNFAPSGSGGGGSTTTYVPLQNYIANNVFLDHNSNTVNPVGFTNLLIAPSNHRGFTPDSVPVVGTWGVVGPDIRFVKNNTAAADQITYPDFVLGDDPLTGDVTPVQYLRYQCTNSPVGEIYKAFQFPINQKVNNLDNQTMTFTVWAKVAVTPVTIELFVRQYFGSGGAPSAEVHSSVGTMVLTTTWTKYNIQLTIPNTAGKTLGSCGDDALYLQLGMPLGTPCDVWFTKPSLYLGSINPSIDFNSYDQIATIIAGPRPSEVTPAYYATAKRGWIYLNDGSIGSASSGATTRANIDTFFLFKTIWDNVSDTWAPVSGGRGATAVSDFAANKRLTLTRALGRAMSVAGTGSGLGSRALGEFAGSETVTLSISEMPAHTHPGSVIPGVNGAGTAPAFLSAIGTSTAQQSTIPATIASQGGNAPHNNVQPTTFYNFFMKL